MPERLGRFRFWHLLVAAAIIGAFVGIFLPGNDPDDPAPDDISIEEEATKGLNRRATAQEQVELTIVDRDRYDALIGEHRGKVVLVDFWATWCLPCIEQLPHTIQLADRLGPGGLEVVTMSFDDPVEKQHVADLLRSKQAGRLTNLISQYGGGPQSMTAFEIESGAVPHYKLYDRAGRLRHTFELDPLAREQFTPQEIDAAVEQLLAE